MTAQQLEGFLWGLGITTEKGLVADAVYSLPSREWFLGKFAATLGRLLWALKLAVWIRERFDCDGFARLAAALAEIWHAVTSSRETGIAVGEFWYVRAVDRQPHAIVAAIVEEAEERELVFMEPQTRQELRLSEEEVQSCVAYRF